jgi:hypothetical protein
MLSSTVLFYESSLKVSTGSFIVLLIIFIGLSWFKNLRGDYPKSSRSSFLTGDSKSSSSAWSIISASTLDSSSPGI